MSELRCGRFVLPMDRPLIMGIVNLTPDSFSGDGFARQREAAIDQAWRMLEAGADLLDLGAESSRPGALPTPEDEELARLLPVLDALRDCGKPLSVDTYKPAVMRAALDRGADMINDIYAFRMAGAFDAVVRSDCALCLMHMQGEPQTMQQQPEYADVTAEVRAFLGARVEAARLAGIADDRLLLDPGFGFGKTLAHNVDLYRTFPACIPETFPVLVGVSRKSMLGAITGRPVHERLSASVVAALVAVQRGARIVRVHDVAATRDALAVWEALR